MSLGFDNIQDNAGQGYLRQAGLQQEATFNKLTYVFDNNWEGFDIEFTTSEGKMFRERTFGANKEKVYPKAKWQDGKQVGMETKEEAFDRVQAEISKKLFWLGATFVDSAVLKEKVKNVRDLKDLIDKVNKALDEVGARDTKVNFLTMWKNSETKQRSNLILADKVKWIEPTKYNADGSVQRASIQLTTYQLSNNMIERYPYNANSEATASEAPVVGGAADDLPF